ncbi:hypothetical protein BJY52DRAFT_1307754 [Lactarius psammicola]|nr:hypothetical protein BJY52DRAFT_1307754 [Lactarius psammicola]
MSPDHQCIPIPLSPLSWRCAPCGPQDQIPRMENHDSSQAKTNFLDGSDTLFSMYNEKACEFDSKLIRNWREDADNLILLSGLVSASVAAFLSQSLSQSQDDSSSNLSPDDNSQPAAPVRALTQGLVRQYLLLTQLQSTGSPHRSARIRVCMTENGFPEFVSNFLRFLNLLLHMRSRYLASWHKLLHATTEEIGDYISTGTTTLDARAVSWLINFLTHEQELELFIIGIPGFYSSTQVENPAQVLRDANSDTIPKAIVALVNHSLSSDLVSDTTRQKRATVSLKAMQTDPYLLQRTFYHALCSTKSAIFNSLTFFPLADQYADGEDPNIRSLARCIVAIAINHREGYNSDWRWAGIVQRRLDWQRDSVKLRNLVRLAWELYSTHPGSGSPSPEIFRNSLHVARRLNVEAAALELRHEFCNLWNWLVAALRGWPEHPTFRSNVMLILSSIHPIFVPLHQNTESQPSALSSSTSDPGLLDPSSYPQCTVASHRPSTFASPNANTPVAHGAGGA